MLKKKKLTQNGVRIWICGEKMKEIIYKISRSFMKLGEKIKRLD